MNWSDRLLIVAVLIAVPLLMIGLPIYLLFGGLRTFALRPLKRCFEGINVHPSPLPGDVTVVYHTYRGLLLWCTQDEHIIFAPPDEALKLLKRLRRFNLTWGLLSYGMLLIPLLTLGNYAAQVRSVEEQRAGVPESSSSDTK